MDRAVVMSREAEACWCGGHADEEVAGFDLGADGFVRLLRCRSCGTESTATVNCLLCAACGNWQTELARGDELLLLKVELSKERLEVTAQP